MSAARPLPKLYIRMMDAAEMFSVSRSALYEAAGRGELTIYKPTGSSLLKVAEVEAWMEARTAQVGQRVGRRAV